MFVIVYWATTMVSFKIAIQYWIKTHSTAWWEIDEWMTWMNNDHIFCKFISFFKVIKWHLYFEVFKNHFRKKSRVLAIFRQQCLQLTLDRFRFFMNCLGLKKFYPKEEFNPSIFIPTRFLIDKHFAWKLYSFQYIYIH